MEVSPTVSVVIPAWKRGEDVIAEQLEALAAQELDEPWEVVVADNGSTDGTVEVANGFSDRLPDLRIIKADDRRGVPHARNCGVRAARADLILLCDADDVVAPGWLRAMATALRTCDHVGGLMDELTINDPVVCVWNHLHRTDALPVALELLPYATGASCGVRREVFDAIGGWDEEYGMAANDVEFSFRVQLAGYRLCWVPEAIVFYRFRPSMSAHALKSFRTGYSYAHLMSDFGRFGARDRSWRRRLRDWGKLLATTPAATHRTAERGLWVGMVASELGRARGWVAFRRGGRRDSTMGPS